MTTKYGMFSEPAYLHPGTAYRKEGKTQKITEFASPNIKATIPRTGKGNDATFDTFKPLFEKDPYLSANRRGNGQCGVVEHPWKVPSPMKHSSGMGGVYGTIGGRIEHISVQGEQSVKSRPEVPIRGIYTCPAKKGSYGRTKTTLSQNQNPLGVVSEYAYKTDPYRSRHEMTMEEGRKERALRWTEAPFKPSGGCQAKIYGKGICGEYAYHPEGESTSSATKASIEVPFKPAGRPKHGISKTIGKFPEFLPNGSPVDLRREKSSRPPATEPWKPSSSFKTDCIRSIVRMNT